MITVVDIYSAIRTRYSDGESSLRREAFSQMEKSDFMDKVSLISCNAFFELMTCLIGEC